MATDPAFASAPIMGLVQVSATADGTPTAEEPTGGVTTLVSGGTNGTKVEQVVVASADVDLDPCVVNLWLTDDSGTTRYLFDSFLMAGNNSSTTAAGERIPRPYSDLVIPNGVDLEVSCTVASQLIHVTALGGDI